MSLRVFPVASVPGLHFSDDWGDPRSGGRTHQGNDIFAPSGTPVVAVDDGAVRFVVDPIGGRSFYLRTADGVTYYGTHLSGYEGVDRAVKAGDVIGYVGTDGNAAGKPAHLHFEVHPGGGPVDPYPLLMKADRRTAPAQVSPARTLLFLGLLGAGIWYVHRRW